MRRTHSEDFVFSLTQPSSPQSSSPAYQVLQKQAYLRRLQLELQYLLRSAPVSSKPTEVTIEQLAELTKKQEELSEETYSLLHVLERTAASVRVVRDKVTRLTEDKFFVEKKLNEVIGKISRAEETANDLGLRATLSEETVLEQKEIRGLKIAQSVSKLWRGVTESKSFQLRIPKTDTLTEKRVLKDKIASRNVLLQQLSSEKEKSRAQLTQLKESIIKVTIGMDESDIIQCVRKYEATANSVEALSQQAQMLLEKVAEADKEKMRLEAILRIASAPVVESTPRPCYESQVSTAIYELEEPKWVSYFRSSFKLLLKAIDLADECGKLGPGEIPSGLSLALLLEKKLMTALCIAQQRAKIRAKVSGSRKLRSITKAAILNKNVRPKQLAPNNSKQMNWEVNALKEKMYTSHFVRDVCLPGSALSPQVKISSSERLEALLSGAARLKYEVKSKFLEIEAEPTLVKSDEPSLDYSEAHFVSEVKTQQKNRSIARGLFARNRHLIFKNMISLAADRRRKRLRTVSSSANIRSDLEEIMGVHGIAKQLRTLDAQLGAMAKKRRMESSPSLKDIYTEMTAAKKKAKAYIKVKASDTAKARILSAPSKETESEELTSKPSQRVKSPIPLVALSHANETHSRVNSFGSPRSFKP